MAYVSGAFDARRSVPEQARALVQKSGDAPQRPCRVCGNLVAVAVLSNHGGLCGRCAAEYTGAAARQPSTAAPEVLGAKAWAHRLRQRERGGEVLTPITRRMWRDALGVAPHDPA